MSDPLDFIICIPVLVLTLYWLLLVLTGYQPEEDE